LTVVLVLVTKVAVAVALVRLVQTVLVPLVVTVVTVLLHLLRGLLFIAPVVVAVKAMPQPVPADWAVVVIVPLLVLVQREQ
jgi:hypothetical protein